MGGEMGGGEAREPFLPRQHSPGYVHIRPFIPGGGKICWKRLPWNCWKPCPHTSTLLLVL